MRSVGIKMECGDIGRAWGSRTKIMGHLLHYTFKTVNYSV